MIQDSNRQFIKRYKYGIIYLMILYFLILENSSNNDTYEELSQMEQKKMNELEFESTEAYDCGLQMVSKEDELLMLDKPFEQCKRKVVHHENVNNKLIKEISRLKSNHNKLTKRIKTLQNEKLKQRHLD